MEGLSYMKGMLVPLTQICKVLRNAFYEGKVSTSTSHKHMYSIGECMVKVMSVHLIHICTALRDVVYKGTVRHERNVSTADTHMYSIGESIV